MVILLNQVIADLPDLKVQMAHLGCGGKVAATLEVFEAYIHGFAKKPSLNKNRFFLDIAAVISDGSKPLTEALSTGKENTITNQIRRWGVQNIIVGNGLAYF